MNNDESLQPLMRELEKKLEQKTIAKVYQRMAGKKVSLYTLAEAFGLSHTMIRKLVAKYPEL